MDEARMAVAGSARQPPQGARHIGPLDAQAMLQASVVLRRRGAELPPPQAGCSFSRDEHAARYAADPAQLEAVTAFAARYALKVEEQLPQARLLRLSGSAEAMRQAFGAELEQYELGGRSLHCHHGELSLPQSLQPHVMAVLGLDSRPVARAQFRRSAKASNEGAFTPAQVADLYAFPDDASGAGQTIALIELGGGYREDDLQTYFQNLNIAAPQLLAVAVDGATNAPGGEADAMVMLDIEVAAAVAPGVKLVVYFAPNTEQGFHDAIAQAVHDSRNRPQIVSIGWGGSEDSWTAQAREAMNAALQDAAALGVTVTVACGDSGADDGAGDKKLHVDFPAASPWVLACGGTRLQASGSVITSERVWNELPSNEGATGGGVSRYFALPDYQREAGVPPQPETKFAGRGVPDVSGVADPGSGYVVRVDGQDSVIGGTSAVAPLWAGLIALLNQRRGAALGFVNPLLYPASSAFRDIVNGNNGYYDAAVGWDACTGLGSPNGVALAQVLGKGA